MRDSAAVRVVLAGLLVLALGACAGPRAMMPTPTVYVGGADNPYAGLDESRRTTAVRLFYATDREPETAEDGSFTYGYGRSESIGFGTVDVVLGPDLTWDELVAASLTDAREKRVYMEVAEIEELLRGPPTPLPYTIVDNRIVEQDAGAAERAAGNNFFRAEMLEALAQTDRKEVFLYVHGYHNTFDDAVFAMAELWHFLGRVGVPIVYTWPAGHPGIFGYTYDRESSEFTVYHMRRALRVIASIPEIEKVHVIAHSRGTDVVVTALRELSIMARAAGRDPRVELKIHDVVLAAPDLDVQVATQRMMGDRLGISVSRFTIYTSAHDRAIGISSRLFASPRGRIGTFGMDNVTTHVREAMEFSQRADPDAASFAFVRYTGNSAPGYDQYGHSYFRNAPAVSSDLVRLLRDDIEPGEPGRPLVHQGLRFYELPPDYPNHAPAQ